MADALMTQEPAPFITLTGPTGSGKSDLAIDLARFFHGEVVNCDSIQLYRYFNIGAAKIEPAGRFGVPHHLIDLLDPDQVFTAGDYSRTARRIISEITGRGTLPIVAGGTGFYLSALLHGLFQGPSRDEHLRTRLAAKENSRTGFLHRLLKRYDPLTASRIHANDVQKLIRAVEIFILGQRPTSEFFAAGRDPLTGYRLLQIGLNPPREILYERLNQRSERMFREGLMEEVRTILALGYSNLAKPFESVGYRQAVEHLEGRLTLEEAIASTQMHTRRYAKRQWTWFRRDRSIHWFDGFGADESVRSGAHQLVSEFLAQCP